MQIPFPMMYSMSLIIKLRSRNQFPNLQTDMSMTRFFPNESETWDIFYIFSEMAKRNSIPEVPQSPDARLS